MRALYFDGEVKLREINDPEPGDGEALIGVITAGVCRTDIEIMQGYMDFRGVLGHEFVGSVMSCESRPDLVGSRVVGEINISPTIHDELLRRHCPNRRTLGILGKDGCFAEKLTLPADNLHTVPDDISTAEAVFVEPLAAALEILEQVSVRPTDRIAVVGDGKLGLLVTQVLCLTGAAVTVVGKHDSKLELAEAFGAATVKPKDLGSERYDIVVDCAGSPSGFQAALSLAEPMGTLVLKTTTAVPPDFHTSKLVIDEITVIGSRCGPFAPALKLLERKLVDVEPLVDGVYPLDDGIEALRYAAKPGVLKVLLDVADALDGKSN